MPSDKPDKVEKWRHPVSAVKTLTAAAFAELVIEEGLRVIGPLAGYVYAAVPNDDGYDMIRTVAKASYRWQYTNRFTETGAAGGTNAVMITPPAGTSLRLIGFTVIMCNAGAGRSVTCNVRDEDGATCQTWLAASLDDQTLSVPSVGVVATAANNTVNTLCFEVVGNGSYVQLTAAAIAQNEYFDIRCVFEVIGSDGSTLPTVAHTSDGTASTGTPTQNELTAVVVTE